MKLKRLVFLICILFVFLMGLDGNSQTSTVSFGNYKLFFDSVKDGKKEVVLDCINHGADINYQNKSKETVLHLACAFNHTKIAKILIGKKANINAQDIRGWTPLHYAIINNNFTVVKSLYDHGANVNLKNKQRQSVFQWCVANDQTKNFSMTKLLIKNAKINTQDGVGYTPLHIAVLREKIDLVRILLKHADANPLYKGGLVHSPIEIAYIGPRKDIYQLLKNHIKGSI